MKRILVIGLCLLLSACSSVKKIGQSFAGGEDNSEKPTELSEITQRLKVIEIWSENVGKGNDKKYLKLAPRVEEDAVYIADNRGDLSALSASNGKTIWQIDTDQPISGGPGAGHSLVLVGTQEGEVLAFNEKTGEQLWTARVSSEILSAPQIAEDIVVTRTIDGKIFGINAKTGKRLWIYDRSVPSLTLRGTSTPIIDSGLVFAGFDGGKLAALELGTGKLYWETRIAQGSGRSELERMVDIDAEPIIDAGTIYVATFQGNIAAVEMETGRIQWARDISSHAGLGLNDDHIFVTDENSHVWALDRFSGASIWRQEKLRARAATAPVSIGNFVVVGDLEGYLHWMDSSTGDFIARTQINKSKIIAPPIVVQQTLYAYSSDGTLSAFTYQGAPSPKVEMEVEEDIILSETEESSTDANISEEQSAETEENPDEEKSWISKLKFWEDDDDKK